MEASQAIIFAQSFNNGPQFFPAARMLGITVAGATFHTDKVFVGILIFATVRDDLDHNIGPSGAALR